MRRRDEEMATRVGTNGFGRVGPAFTRHAAERGDIEVVAVNDVTDAGWYHNEWGYPCRLADLAGPGGKPTLVATRVLLRPAPSPPAGQPVSGRWLALVVLCVTLLMVALDNTVLNVALPTLVRDLHASTTDLQWIVDNLASTSKLSGHTVTDLASGPFGPIPSGGGTAPWQ
jgi:hypothetical protein